MNANSKTPDSRQNRGKRIVRNAIIIAAAFHILLLVYLSFQYIQTNRAYSKAIASTDSHHSQSPQKRATAAKKKLPLEESPLASIEEPKTESEQIQRQLKDSQAVAESMSDEEKQDELDRRAKWLDKNSSKDNIDQITKTIMAMTGTLSRATEPAINASGHDFDFDTAQIHEVSRKPQGDGSYNYFYVMLDANGQTMDIEAPREEGKKTYETFEKLKKSPLAMKIYRQMVMPMLDQALKSKRVDETSGNGE